MKSLLTVVMAGGRGSRLSPLTETRAKPAVPLCGRPLIDYTLANCERARLKRVVVLTQYRSESVEAHVARRWSDRLGLCSTYSSTDAGRPFLGTADAVRAALDAFGPVERLLVLAADHVYEMDYRAVLARHQARRADATICTAPVPRAWASGLGIVGVDGEGRVESFQEKPTGLPGGDPEVLASMGIYVFEAARLQAMFDARPDVLDFGHDVLPALLRERARLYAHRFDGRLWMDIADVDAYWRAHMDLLPRRNGRVARSFLGRQVRLGPRSRVEDSVVLDGATIGANCRLRRVVVEEGVTIPPNTIAGYDREADARQAWVTPGGVVVFTAKATQEARREPQEVAG